MYIVRYFDLDEFEEKEEKMLLCELSDLFGNFMDDPRILLLSVKLFEVKGIC